MIDFFEQQEKARTKSHFYTFVYILFFVIIAVLLTTTIIVTLPTMFFEGFTGAPTAWKMLFNNPMDFIESVSPTMAGVLFFIIITSLFGIGISIYKGMIKEPGQTFFEDKKAKLVTYDTKDPKKRILLNVVEEMAIAAGLPTPPTYLFDEKGINAVASGGNPFNAVVAVTQGALDHLERDELQGLVAHEVSHIASGDIKLDLLLQSLAVTCTLMSFVIFVHPLAAIIFLPFAIVGFTASQLSYQFTAFINRQREFIADAMAIQLTRSNGLKNALKKVRQLGSRFENFKNEGRSFTFFAEVEPPKILSTHPTPLDRSQSLSNSRIDSLPDQSRGRDSIENTDHAISLRRNRIPDEVTNMVDGSLGACIVAYHLFLSTDDYYKEKQLFRLKQSIQPLVYDRLVKSIDEGLQIQEKHHLQILNTIIAPLKQLSGPQIEEFMHAIKLLIEADNQVDLKEYLYSEMITRHLQSQGWKLKINAVPLSKNESINYLINLVAHFGHDEQNMVSSAFKQVGNKLEGAKLRLLPAFKWNDRKFNKAILGIEKLTPKSKQHIYSACIKIVRYDRKITVTELEVLELIRLCLGLPYSYELESLLY